MLLRVLVADLEREWRGGQEQALLLMRGLKRLGHSAELLAARRSAIAVHTEAAGIPVHAVGEAARRVSAALRIGQLLRQTPVDVVYANEAHALTAAWMAHSKRRAPLVAARRVVFPLSRSPVTLARYRAAARIIAISQAVRSELLNAGVDSKRIEIVFDGIEIPDLVTPEIRGKARKRWGFRADETVIVSVGALTPEKGHALLIDTFAKLRQQFANCRLLIAGEGPLRGQLDRQARQAGPNGSVMLAGFIAEIDSIYQAADVFVFPSLQEGGGTSLLRAMAFALPVLALARGGVAEIIEDGRNGILVQQASAQALEWAAAGMIGEPELRQQLGAAARETVAERFSADRMVDATVRVFKQLSSESAPE